MSSESNRLIQDPLQEIAIQEGTQQIEVDEPAEVVLRFTQTDTDMLRKLASSLALSIKVLVESAISYVYFYTKQGQVNIKELPEYPKTLGSKEWRLNLALETVDKLEKLEMAQHPSECAATGIRLLYGQLIEKAKSEA